MSFNIKILTTIVLIISALLFSFSTAFAQYKLELEWQKEPGGQSFYISSITKSDNDSVIYIAGQNIYDKYYEIKKIDAFSGETLQTVSAETSYNLIMSRNGQLLIAGGGSGVGLLDPISFKRIYWDTVPNSNYKSLSFNEKQNKFVISGETTLRVYDINKKEMIRDYKLGGINAKLTDNGKYIVYTTSYQNGSSTEYRMSIIDTSGQEIKNFETTSPTFAFTNDGKNLIYFDKVAAHLLNLETMQETSNFPNEVTGYGLNPSNIELSSDGKFMVAGARYYEFENKNKCILEQIDISSNFKLNYQNSSVYVGNSRNLYKFNLKPITSVPIEANNLDFTIQTNLNNLIVSSQSTINPNLQFSIIGIDGKLIRQILPNDIQLNNNSASIDISSLTTGAYLLQVSSNSEVVFSSKFLKVD